MLALKILCLLALFVLHTSRSCISLARYQSSRFYNSSNDDWLGGTWVQDYCSSMDYGTNNSFFFCGTPFVLRYSHPCKPRSHIAFAKSQGAIKKFSLRKGQSGFQIFAHGLIFIPEAFDIFKHTETPNTAVGNICSCRIC